MDFATIFGLGGGFALILIAMVAGGTVSAYLDWPSILIVFGGTIATTMTSFSVPELLGAQRSIQQTLFRQRENVQETAREVLELAERARRQGGGKEIEKLIKPLNGRPFLQKGLTMILDGAAPDEIERLLRQELTAMSSRHSRSAGVLRRAAEVAPAMGLIGTLVGLVQLLGNLQRPETIGPAMALALLTTFYGAVLSNMVLAPLASKLERNSHVEALLMNVYTLCVVSIGRQENPRRLESLINAILPPADRVSYFK